MIYVHMYMTEMSVGVDRNLRDALPPTFYNPFDSSNVNIQLWEVVDRHSVYMDTTSVPSCLAVLGSTILLILCDVKKAKVARVPL